MTVSEAPNHLRTMLSLTASYLAFPLIALITSPIIARALGPTGRGEVAAISSPITLAESVASWGLPIGAAFFVASGFDGYWVFRKALPFALTSGALTYIAIFISAPALLHQYHSLVPILRLSGLYVLAVALIGLLRGIRNGEQSYRLLATERWVQAVSRLLLVVFVAAIGWLTISSAVWINVGCAVGAALVLLAGGRSPTRSSDRGSREQESPSGSVIVRFCLASWGGQVSSTVNARLDQSVLIAFVSARDLGFYTVAAMAAELPMTFFLATQRIVIGSAVGADKVGRAQRALRLGALFGVVITICSVVAGPTLIAVLFGSSYEESTQLLVILLLGVTPWGLSQILTAGLAATGRPGRASLGELGGAIVTAAGLPVLTPSFGVVGAAWISVVAYTATAVVKLVFFRARPGIDLKSCLIFNRDDANWLRHQILRLPFIRHGNIQDLQLEELGVSQDDMVR